LVEGVDDLDARLVEPISGHLGFPYEVVTQMMQARPYAGRKSDKRWIVKLYLLCRRRLPKCRSAISLRCRLQLPTTYALAPSVVERDKRVQLL
jgi:hypothetical protein